VNEFYLTADPDRAKEIIDQYGVEYIVVGQLEQALYPGMGLKKFDAQDGILWEEVFHRDDTAIYHVLD
jgi:uncharacterized membrane protein